MSVRAFRAASSLTFLCRRNAYENVSKRFIAHLVTRRVSEKSIQSFNRKPELFSQSTACVSLFHSTALRWKERVVKCPAFAESVSEGDIHWEKAEGDTVVEDELVAGIETDKVNVPVHAPCAGKIIQLLVKDGDKVTAHQELFKMEEGASGGASAKPKPEKEECAPKQESKPPKEDKPAAPVTQPPPEKPAVDWTTRTVEPPKSLKDLQAKAPLAAEPISKPKPPQAPAPSVSAPRAVKSEEDLLLPSERSEYRVKINRMRKRIAQRLKDAQNTAAMLTTFNEIDMSNIFQLRAQYKDAFQKKHQVKLGFMSAFCKAAAMALKAQPEVNAVIDGEEILYREYVDISIAVATPKGLVVPVLRNVEHMNFAQIEKGIHQLGEKARQNLLAVEDMDGGTFTISNGGVFGSLFGTPIINPPQSAILGLHAVNQRPVVVSGEGATAKIEARPMMFVALTYDHRLIDGREAVTFLRKIKAFIEDPRLVLLDL